MADPKDTTSFFRKVVKFVANPATEWADLSTPADETRENEFARGELKAMIERKRRNDFVRKREFDMLRKVRREGLTSEQLAALGGSSRLDDSEARNPDSIAKADGGVKAKIDEIEQQMVGDNRHVHSHRHPPEFYNALTEPAAMDVSKARRNALASTMAGRLDSRAACFDPGAAPVAAQPPKAAEPARRSDFGLESGLLSQGVGAAAATTGPPSDFAHPFAVEAGDVAHDPELDEAVIAFANADFEQCEQALQALTGPSGARAQHAESWLVLFDFYRAVGRQAPFENLALDYARQFGWSAPQWFSLPKLVAETAGRPARPRSAGIAGQAGWRCAEHIDADAVTKLASLSLQMPLPWMFDWSALRSTDAEACARLADVFRGWVRQDIEMRWIGGERLLAVLADSAPTGVRDVDPAFWQARLEALRLANRPDQFDETAIDYCVTYEVSPPSWEPSRCTVRISSGAQSTTAPPSSVVSDVSTSFLESHLTDQAPAVQMGTVELSGQLVGDISAVLKTMDGELGAASIVNVSCARLIRVDFIAAGDLLNWVLARRSENRTVSFIEAHRMVALFFGAMGINEHARVKVRNV